MGFEELKKSVLEKSKVDAKNITKEAENQAKAEKEKVMQEVKEITSQLETETKRKIEMMEKSELASCSLEVKKKNLVTKKEMIDSVFDNVKENLSKKLPAKSRKVLIGKLVEKAGEEIKIGRIYCNTVDKKHVDFTPVKNVKILGGIIAENKEGTMNVDYSFDTIIDNIKEKHISEVTTILFG